MSQTTQPPIMIRQCSPQYWEMGEMKMVKEQSLFVEVLTKYAYGNTPGWRYYITRENVNSLKAIQHSVCKKLGIHNKTPIKIEK